MNRRKIIAAVAALPLSVALLADAGAESHHPDDASLPNPIDIDTARKRLEVITTDPDVWAAPPPGVPRPAAAIRYLTGTGKFQIF